VERRLAKTNKTSISFGFKKGENMLEKEIDSIFMKHQEQVRKVYSDFRESFALWLKPYFDKIVVPYLLDNRYNFIKGKYGFYIVDANDHEVRLERWPKPVQKFLLQEIGDGEDKIGFYLPTYKTR
jgi:hypothetical protein